MNPTNTPQILEDLKVTAEKFLAIYPEICALVAAQPATTQPVEPEPTIESEEHRISRLLQTLGAPLHIKGYRYLSTAIQMVSKDHLLLFAITKELYPAVAKAHDTTPSRVERAIRHAIGLMADKCNDFYAKSFDDQPTNSEFLAWCVEALKFQA
ncbi:sporulation initiation factor Spo0A C-terminal domain-containing protein [Desulforamulus ruminis]|uniref:Sporulation initiation factor Spo0A n=1 Tax=Desulforamulus ruminis (strain ATCC 23193 / DSM 2154 / NCIMB 8452 / DL) TaxID=696281 RepID=F6DM05_DESRL|nr:sporulation initiation factor Spo0A C-terminal domain-containing protein [Desulforamulus ruminis]AEG59347.1 Sporulation initiation factor Spo0A [Desulforamulus ruminis DSM 2154]